MNVRAPASALLLAVALAGCATGTGVPIGGASYQQGADFSSYFTYDFLPVPPGAARIAASLSYFDIDGVISRDLDQIGLARAIGGTPDLWVAYYQGGRTVSVSDWGYATAGGQVIDIAAVPSSCLVVDLVDVAKRTLVWRGVATDALVSPASVDPAVRQMLQSWPGRQRQ
jgi:hypothetical protein